MSRGILGWVALVVLWAAHPAAAAADLATARSLRHLRSQTLRALALTPEQEDQLALLRDRLRAEQQSIRAALLAGELSSAEGRTRLRDAARNQRQAREAVLTPPQRALLARAREQARQIERGGPADGLRVFEPTDLVASLGLTASQQGAWLDLVAEQRTELEALRRRGEVPTSADVRRLRLEHRRAFEALLTPSQLALLQQLRGQWVAGAYGAAGEPRSR